jgi:hypothetical protein
MPSRSGDGNLTPPIRMLQCDERPDEETSMSGEGDDRGHVAASFLTERNELEFGRRQH